MQQKDEVHKVQRNDLTQLGNFAIKNVHMLKQHKIAFVVLFCSQFLHFFFWPEIHASV